MDYQSAYKELIRYSKETALLDSCEILLRWDERVCMPKGGTEHRSQQRAILAGIAHERATAPIIGDLLSQVEESDFVGDSLSVTSVNVRELRRTYDRLTKLPRSLVEELTRVISRSSRAWTEARATSNFELFRPHLEQVVQLKQEEAAALHADKSAYDSLLDGYEPGETVINLTRVFGALKEELVDLVESLADVVPVQGLPVLEKSYPLDRQKVFRKSVAAAIGFDFERGRLDESAHPFCIGIGPGDTRITTRYTLDSFTQGFFMTLHEAGHGLYEQGSDPTHFGTPMGRPVSTGIHESQSRLWENFVGRSEAFWIYFFPQAQDLFRDTLGQVKLGDFYRSINKAQPSFIRVEADELTYNLHIFLRFELEEALISGDLAVADLPGAWNDNSKKYLRLTPPDDTKSCLQDVHWSQGMFGYFPTYTLGNLYAAQFFAQAQFEVEGLNEQFKVGDYLPLREWLTEKIYRHGKRYRARELAIDITGKPLSHRPLMDYLKGKFESLYDL